jgi:methylated-DNA-[protein]-cysteine S-methyltransferase
MPTAAAERSLMRSFYRVTQPYLTHRPPLSLPSFEMATRVASDTGVARRTAVGPVGAVGVEATVHGVRRVRLPGEHAVADDLAGAGVAATHAAAAATQIAEYLDGERESFDVVLDWEGVDATHRHMLETLCEIAPYGTTVTYGELGRRAGVDDPREVGIHMARNPLPLVVPCHRVVASDGLGGFGGGLELKKRLLELEGVLPPRLDLDV